MASGSIEEPGQGTTAPQTGPAAPTPQKTVAELMFDRLDIIEKRLDQQATATVKILEMLTSSPGTQQPAQASGLMGLAEQLIPQIGKALNDSGGEEAMYARIGKSVFDGALDGTIKRVIKAAGTEGAKHVTGLG